MVDTAKSDLVVELARMLEEHNGIDTVVLDIHEHSSWTDFFVISTARSATHMQGLFRFVRRFLSDHKIEPLRRHKRVSDDGWLLVDCGNFVIHLMSEEVRAFYELERLWFSGVVLFHSSKSS